MTSGAAEWDRRFAEQTWSNDPDPLLVEMVGGLAPGAAIDLGCGPGRNAIWLAQRGFRVTGVDSSRVGLQQARERARAAGVDLNLLAADLTELQIPAGSLDLLVLANIHPGPDGLAALLERAVRWLRVGGHLFVVGHHLDALGHDGPPRAELLYTEDRLLAATPKSVVVERLATVKRDGSPADHGGHDKVVVLWAAQGAGPTDP
ncbi:MAG: class I SAM-dependent methyltransferase [Candidatus Dormibacteria bacterium]